ncbi:MAG TPA: hypothetical protein VKO85_14440 [Wenzhouxiangellaceae bacterium]|nr:hypothetical protein [Wenzhouxiangellaceae bacterium]
MQARTSTFSFAILFALALGATTASADLAIERDVSITDSAGGSLVMLSAGSRDDLGGESTTTATFVDFQAASDRRRINGEVIRERISTAEQVETTYNGVLEIFTSATEDSAERMDTLVFENLVVLREGEGPGLSGQVIFNGEVRQAADLPRPALRMLARALRFFHFA